MDENESLPANRQGVDAAAKADEGCSPQTIKKA